MSSRELVVKSLRVAFRPLVRMALKRSMKLLDLIELLKAVCVDVAVEEAQSAKLTPSASRVSVMTGVHRKDATRLLRNPLEVRETESLLAKVIGHWQSSKRFTTADGRPRVLSAEGIDSEFMNLARTITNDIPPYTLLSELERSGVVERSARGVRLVSNFLPVGDPEGALQILGEDLSDLSAAVDENVAGRANVPHLHLRTDYDNIDPRDVPKIRAFLLAEGSKFQYKVSQFLSRYDRDVQGKQGRATSGKGVRVACGAFSFVDERGGRNES